MNSPGVSIILLNWNGLEDTIECLSSLKRLTYDNYRIIVVDNGSQGDDAQRLKEKYGDVIDVIAKERNSGFAAGVNTGIEHANSKYAPEYILLLNNDTVVDPKFLGELVKLAESDVFIGIVGPKVYYYDSPNLIQLIGARMNMWIGQGSFIGHGLIDTGQFDHEREIDQIVPCGLIKADVIRTVGLFDEAYFCYLEESDYCVRARKCGYKIMYAPKSKIWHKLGHSTRGIPGFVDYYMARNHWRFMRKNASRGQFISFLFFLFGYYFWRMTAGMIFLRKIKRLVGFYRGTIDGLFKSENGSKFYR